MNILQYSYSALFLPAAAAACILSSCGSDTAPPATVREKPSAEPAAPSAQDGTGTASVTPADDVVCSRPGTWTITYTAGQAGIAEGGGIAVHISPFWGWTPPQTGNPAAPGHVTAECSRPDIELDVQAVGTNHYILVRLGKGALAGGDTVTVTYGDTGGGARPEARARADRYAEQHERFYIKVDGDGDGYFFPIKKHPAITILPRTAFRLQVAAPSTVTRGTPFRMCAAALDDRDNRIPSYRGEASVASIPAGAECKKVPSENGRICWECLADAEGIFRFRVRDARSGIEGISNPVACSAQEPRYRLYWGDLHGHSQLSDGTGTADDYYRYARCSAGLDVAALTDHDAWGFDMLDDHPEIWQRIKAAAGRHNAPGSFITFIGYEWTSWKFGHKHVLFLGEPAPLCSSRKEECDEPRELWACLSSCRAMTLSHHVGGGPIGADWNHHDPERELLVEVCSIHGNSEYRGCRASIYNPQPGSFVQDALSRGFRLGIIASGDTHNGHPGMGDPASPVGGLAGIYAEELTREAVWSALKNRRVYGTSGARIIVDFSVNGHMMGSTIPGGPDTERRIAYSVTGSNVLSRIVLVKNGSDYQTWEPGKKSHSFSFVDRTSDREVDYYYLRVVQADGHMAWSSPVWVE